MHRNVLLTTGLLGLVVSLADASGYEKAQLPNDEARTADKPAEVPSSVPASDSSAKKTGPSPRLTFSGIERTEKGGPSTPGSPREVFPDLGIPLFLLESVVDGAPATSQEQELLRKFMARLPSIPLRLAERWVHGDVEPGELREKPYAYRGEFFLLAGRVTEVRRVNLSPDHAARYEFDHYFQCKMTLDGKQGTAIVNTREVPAAWLERKLAELPAKEAPDEPAAEIPPLAENAAAANPAVAGNNGPREQQGPIVLHEAAQAVAVFLKRGEGDQAEAPLHFVARRVAWPDESVLLGQLGMDMGLFDNVVNAQPVLGRERECFYQMLYAVQQGGTMEYYRHALRELKHHLTELRKKKKGVAEKIKNTPKNQANALKSELALVELRIEHAEKLNYELIPVLEHPDRFHGKLRMYRGTARQVHRVRVDDPDIVERFGIDHYYQVDAMIELEAKVKLPREDRVVWAYPVTFCVRDIPAGLPQGSNVVEEILVPGFFFKNWSYPTADEKREKQAPMIIARDVLLVAPEEGAASPYAGILPGVLFLVALLATWLLVWFFSKSDRRFHRETLSREFRLEPGVSLNDLDLDVQPGPDFRNLT